MNYIFNESEKLTLISKINIKIVNSIRFISHVHGCYSLMSICKERI